MLFVRLLNGEKGHGLKNQKVAKTLAQKLSKLVFVFQSSSQLSPFVQGIGNICQTKHLNH